MEYSYLDYSTANETTAPTVVLVRTFILLNEFEESDEEEQQSDKCPRGVNCGNPVEGSVFDLNDIKWEEDLGAGWNLYSYLDKKSKIRKTVAAFILPKNGKLDPPGVLHTIARPVVNRINDVGIVFTNIMTGLRWGTEELGKDSYSTMLWWFKFHNVYFEYSKPNDIDILK